MDTTLVTVTLLSMAMAASLSVIVWRMLRDERRRSEARVIALTSMAAHPSNQAPRASRIAHRGSDPAPRPSAPRDWELEIRDAPLPPSESATPLFAEREVESPWGHRFVVMAALGLVAASVILVSLTANDRTAAGRVAAAGVVTPPAAAQAGPAGLELLSLRDSREAGSLTITGLVHNPRGGATLSKVAVTAYAFDDKGSFLASGRALIDVTALAPGDESPFVVSVPVTEAVARYRIGFRGDDGRVIAHIDKRPHAPVAANW